MTRELAFIDPNIPHVETFLRGLRPDVNAVVLSASECAIKQIANALHGRGNVNAVHIIAHGKPGSVNFASGALTLDTLDDYATDLAEIGDALGRDCALYLWSCNTGQGDRGSAFINALARATGIEVAAATVPVGNAAQGGQWELSTRSATNFGQPPLTPEAVATYDGLLAVTLDLNGGSAGTNDTSSYTEQQSALTLFSAATLVTSGGSSARVDQVTVTLQGGPAAGESLSYSLAGTSGFFANYNATTGVLTISKSDGSDANWQTILRSITYVNTSDTPNTSRVIQVAATDTTFSVTSSATDTITITRVNDAPGAAIVPASYSATEQTTLTLHGTGLSISDVDADTSSMTVTLSVGEGTLNVLAGTTGAVVTGTGTSSVTITGTITQINNLLAGSSGATVTYVDNTDAPSASTTLTMLVHDNGNTGGGDLISSDTATINITSVNDAPVAVADTGNATEAGATPGSNATGNVLANDTDVDTAHGSLAVSEVNGSAGNVGATVGGLYGSLILTSTGSYIYTINNANATVNALNAAQTLTEVFTYRMSDGQGGFAFQTLTITIHGTNDAPVAVADTNSGNEDTIITGNVASNDRDVDNGAVLSYSLVAPVAGLTLNANGSYSFDAGNAAYQHLAQATAMSDERGKLMGRAQAA